jgi:predicted small metal-binding protein
MKTYACGTLVPGCSWTARAETEADLVARAAAHLREAHGETEIRPDMIERIKERITEADDAA